MMYPPHADLNDINSIVEHFDEHTLNILTPKYVQFYDQNLSVLKVICVQERNKIIGMYSAKM